MSKLKIAYLISQYPAISHTFILREVLSLRAMGLDIHVASINAVDRSSEKLTDAERQEMHTTFYVKPAGILGAIKAHTYTLFRHPMGYVRGLLFALKLGQTDFKKLLYRFFYFVEAVMVGRWMEQQGLSHLHVHFGMASATVGMLTTKVFPVTLSMTIHGPDEFYDVYTNHLPEKILAADFICCISDFARSQLMALSPPKEWQKLDVCPLGVDPATFMPPTLKEETAYFEILCVGRLVPVKGQSILLEAVAQLIAQGQPIRLNFVGDGPDRQTLEGIVAEKQLTESVHFAGAVNQDKILTFYQQADVFILASFAEGVPVVLMEAMAMEIPCISTHITGIPELIKKNAGILVPPGNAKELAKAIEQLINDPDLRKNLGKAGREWVIQHYNLNKNTQTLLKLFQRRLTTNTFSQH